MNKMQKAALDYLYTNWHNGMAGGSDTAEILGMNPNTLKTRIARNQAMVMREQGGDTAKPLRFSGFHLIFNLIQDRMMRYGFSSGSEDEATQTAYSYAEWVMENVLSGEHKTNAVLRLKKDSSGFEQVMLYEDGDVMDWTGDAVVAFPIGTMAVRIAFSMLMRNGDVDALLKLAKSDE